MVFNSAVLASSNVKVSSVWTCAKREKKLNTLGGHENVTFGVSLSTKKKNSCVGNDRLLKSRRIPVRCGP